MAAGPLLIKHDTDLAQAVIIVFTPGGKPDFQFPPICTGDTKAGHYIEKDVIANDTMKIGLGSEARNLTIEATYVVDGDWTASDIFQAIRTLKANLYEGKQDEVRFATIDFYHISEGSGTYAYMSFDVKYEGPIMGSGADAWPMVTKATMVFKSWTQLTDKEEVDGLQADISPEWY